MSKAASLDRVADVASNASYTVSTGTIIVGGLTANELLAIGGFALALATFVVNWVYRHKHYQLAKQQLEQERHGGQQ